MPFTASEESKDSRKLILLQEVNLKSIFKWLQYTNTVY
jgi:hypothetical protein